MEHPFELGDGGGREIVLSAFFSTTKNAGGGGPNLSLSKRGFITRAWGGGLSPFFGFKRWNKYRLFSLPPLDGKFSFFLWGHIWKSCYPLAGGIYWGEKNLLSFLIPPHGFWGKRKKKPRRIIWGFFLLGKDAKLPLESRKKNIGF